MSNKQSGAQNASPIETVAESAHDRRTAVATLTAFRQQILAILAVEPLYGLAVKRAVEELRDEPINHGRLNPNLDALVDQGLVAETQRDRRTNEYALTDRGRRVLDAYVGWTAGCLEGGERA